MFPEFKKIRVCVCTGVYCYIHIKVTEVVGVESSGVELVLACVAGHRCSELNCILRKSSNQPYLLSQLISLYYCFRDRNSD